MDKRAVISDQSIRALLVELAQMNHQRTLSIPDALTKLTNQRYFDTFLVQERRRSLLTATPLSVTLIDIDQFKRDKAAYGLQDGDGCLSKVATGSNRNIEMASGFGCSLKGYVTREIHLFQV